MLTAGKIGEDTVRRRLEVHAAESRQPHLPSEQRRQRVDADAEISGAGVLVEPQTLPVGLDDVEDKVLVAHFRETDFLLRGRQPGHEVGQRTVEPSHVLARLRRQRRLRKEVGVVSASTPTAAATALSGADDELVDAPGFLVEEERR